MISKNERETIFNKFWKLDNHFQQTFYIVNSVQQHPVAKRVVHNSDCEDTHVTVTIKGTKFTLSTGDKCVKVCKQVFLTTLCISYGRLNRALLNQRKNAGVATGDKRGLHDHSSPRVPVKKVLQVVSHIRSFPTTVIHYTRAHSSNRSYLSPNLNIGKMYELHENKCKENTTDSVKLSTYRHILTTRFNLSFHSPWKDTCKKCDFFRTIDADTKENKNSL